MADLGLQLLGGDLGGGYFSGVAPELQWSSAAAVVYALLGTAAAGAGGWLPALAAQRLPLAQTLKGLGSGLAGARGHAFGLMLMACAGLLALLPPVRGIPLGAYLSVGLLLVGGITVLPWAVALLYDRIAPALRSRLLPLLAVERARRVRESAAVAVSGVVASLSLAVALTVMVASFRDSVAHWLDVVLPADLYLRTALSTQAAETTWFSPDFVQAVAQLQGVKRVAAQRSRSLLLDPAPAGRDACSPVRSGTRRGRCRWWAASRRHRPATSRSMSVKRWSICMARVPAPRSLPLSAAFSTPAAARRPSSSPASGATTSARAARSRWNAATSSG